MSDNSENQKELVFHEPILNKEHVADSVNLSPIVKQLISIFTEEKTSYRQGSRYSVSRTVSTLAVLYEKARNAVEFRAEHLVRRAAIERIFKRRVVIDTSAQEIAENLTLELLWARYIDSSLVDDEKNQELAKIIGKYLTLRQALIHHPSQYKTVSWETIAGIASSEIDEMIVSPVKREALNDFYYQAIRPKIRIDGKDEQYVNMQAYIGIERAFAQVDEPVIIFHLIKLIMPEWLNYSSAEIQKSLDQFLSVIVLIQDSVKDPIGLPISRYIRRNNPPFLLLRDFFLERGGEVKDIISDAKRLDTVLTEIASRRYQEIRKKVNRAVVRSIIYIFLTKMVFALALEVPVDLFIMKKIAYLPVIINSLFPPIMLFLIAGFFNVPGNDNTKSLIERIHSILYRFDDLKFEHDVFKLVRGNKRPILTAVFTLLYVITFGVCFGIITWTLTRLHFNVASQIIFIFFMALVTFFAYRIRQSAKEYELVEKQGLFEPVMDLFLLPILRAGHWLSAEIAKLNIFIILFDFILEAPLKVIFEVVEEWIRFIRTKKEELV